MKHLRKFNEAEEPKKYEMTLKDYFYDFSDNGFTIDVEDKDNMVTGKYVGEYDFEAVFDMYQDAITKLTHYFGSITRTSFDYKKSVVNFTIQVKNKINDVDSIEIETKNGKLILKPSRYSVYLTNRSINPGITELILFCKDETNRSYNISWKPEYFINGKGPNYLTLDPLLKPLAPRVPVIIVRVGSSNVKIDLENATKIYNMISNNIIPIWYHEVYSQQYIDNAKTSFSLYISPELLTKI